VRPGGMEVCTAQNAQTRGGAACAFGEKRDQKAQTVLAWFVEMRSTSSASTPMCLERVRVSPWEVLAVPHDDQQAEPHSDRQRRQQTHIAGCVLSREQRTVKVAVHAQARGLPCEVHLQGTQTCTTMTQFMEKSLSH
jgi:hypothetical protein